MITTCPGHGRLRRRRGDSRAPVVCCARTYAGATSTSERRLVLVEVVCVCSGWVVMAASESCATQGEAGRSLLAGLSVSCVEERPSFYRPEQRRW